ARELFDALEPFGTAIHVAPDGAAGFDPRGLDALRKELRIGSRTEVRKDRAVDQRVEIATDHHHAPRCCDCAGDGRGFAESLCFVASVAQLEGPVERLAVAETDGPSTAAVSFERHAAVVDEVGLGDRGVSEIAGQLDGERRSGPLAKTDL